MRSLWERWRWYRVPVTETCWLIGIALVALLGRLAWVAYSPCQPVSDFMTYDTSARGLAQGLGYVRVDGATPTAYWPVGYPLFLAGIYKVFGHSHLAAKLVQALLGTLTVLLVYALARHIHQGAARAASLLLALWPSQVGYTSLLASENLFTPLFLGSVVAVVSAGPGLRRSMMLLPAGLLMGAAGLVRPVGLLVAPAAVVWWLLSAPGRWAPRRLLLGALALAMSAMVVIAPWTVRNAIAMKAFVLISTNGGANLALGNNPQATGAYMDLPAGIVTKGQTEVQADRAAYRFAKAYIAGHPGAFFRLGLRKMYHLFSRDTGSLGWAQFTKTSRRVTGFERYLLAGLGQLYYMGGGLLALAGLLSAWRKHPVVILTLIVTGLWVAFHFVYFGGDRFHAPLIPFLAILGGIRLGACSRAKNDSAPAAEHPSCSPV